MVKRRINEEEETFKGRKKVDRLEMNEMRENWVVKNDRVGYMSQLSVAM